MATKTKQWSTGSGSATIQYDGQGDGQIVIASDPNSVYEARSMQITVETSDGSGIQRIVTVTQAAKQRIDLSAAVVTAANQTYSGSAKTPTPTVTLNGTVIPSTGYDVTYSNNINAGTATITVTGKGDYTGTAYGTFTINKATPTYTAPTARSLTYSGSAQYLTTTGSTSHGTIQYSSDGTNWYSTRRQGTNAGDYTTYWRLVGDSNHTDISATSISTTIAKATPSYTAPSTRSLTYSGSSQYLTTSGSTSHGTIYYSTDGSNWYTSRRTGTNAGTYYCYWKLVGDSNHTDISSTYIGTTTIAKASRSIYWSSYPSSLRVGESDTLSAYVSAGSGDGSISYSSSNSSRARVSGSTVTAVSQGTCTIYASVSEGTNYLSASTSYTLTVSKAIPAGCVDMGNNVVWAVGNITKDNYGYYAIGAPTDYGAYFSWGDIDGHDGDYDFDATNYNSGLSGSGHTLTTAFTSGDSTYDAASAQLGGNWRMPTQTEYEWLLDSNNCYNTWVTNYQGSGVSGRLFTSRITGNELFFPKAGYYDGVSYDGDWGAYWSTNKSGSDAYGRVLGISSSTCSINGFLRYFGMTIRPVQDI